MNRDWLKIILSAILFFLAIFVDFGNGYINNVLYIVSYLIVGLEIVIKAVKNIFKGKVFDEHFLMSIATIGAFAIGEFPEAVAVMLFYQVGESFQDYAVDKSKKSIADLMDIRPDYANLKNGDIIEKVSPDKVKVGDIIVVKPGERVSLDGIVVAGDSFIDTSALTGESVPKRVEVNSKVISGCINQSGVLEIKVEKEFGESTVSKILDLVQNASEKKSKTESFITKFAKYYTPIVVLIAVFLAVVPPLIITDAVFTEWLYRALTFLVVSCPCALVISVPLSFFGGIGAASREGILVKGSNYLELLSKTKTIAFDKTGTLTEGVFEVQEVEAIGIEKQELLKLVAHAEIHSNHPIAKSIIKAYGKEADSNIVTEVKEISGCGIKANVNSKNIVIGNEQMMKNVNVGYSKCNKAGTVLYVAIDNKYAGYILIADRIKDDAKKAIADLKHNGINKIIMFTGDKKEIAENVASQLMIDEVYAELLPNDKAEKMEE